MNQQTYLLFLAIHLLFPSTCDNKINLTPFLNPYTLGKAYLIYVWCSWNTHGQLLAVVTNYASHANYGQSLKGHTPLNIRTHLIKAAATISSSALALGLFATTAWAAPAATITLDKDTVSWGDTVNVTVTSIEGDNVKFDMVQTIDKDQVAKQISEELGQQFGTKPETLTCPENLKGTPGATLRCELKDSGQTYGVTVTVNKVDGSDVNYGFKVDDKPTS